jgi:hypothetical protein
MTLKVERAAEQDCVVFALSGRIEAGLTAELQKLIDLEAESRSVVFDLKQVQLVDQGTVRFLARCDAKAQALSSRTVQPIFGNGLREKETKSNWRQRLSGELYFAERRKKALLPRMHGITLHLKNCPH